MPSIEEDDCLWIVQKAKEKLQENLRHEAHAWILTAKSLFPFRFIVQYEAFKLHLACNELQGAAQTLVELCTRFQKEEELQKLVGQLVDELSGLDSLEGAESKSELRDVFELLPPSSQKTVLIGTAENIVDVLWRAKITIVILKRFPETVTTLGLDLYDSLAQSSSGTCTSAVSDSHRNVLVTELIPLLATSGWIVIDQPTLRSSGQTLVLKTSHICQWLEVSACYLTTITVERTLGGKNSIGQSSLSGKAAWECLHKIFLMVAEKCGWAQIVLSNKQISPHLPAKVRWKGLEYVSGFSSSQRVPFDPPRQVAIACFYISVFLFFETAWSYYSHVHQITENSAKCWALIEDVSLESRFLKVKKKQEEQQAHSVLVNLQTPGTKSSDSHLENFFVAIDCYNFLHSCNTYRSEFSRLCQQWNTSDWSWLVAFKADMMLYKGDIEAVRRILQHERQKMKANEREKLENVRVLLQLVNSYLLLGDIKNACNLATELVGLLPDDKVEGHSHPETPPPPPGQVPSRSLYLIGCTNESILPYVINIITYAVKDVVFSDACTDVAIGQLLVLLQYNWTRNKADPSPLMPLMSLIKKRGSFTYQKFFNYVVVVDILEEMMYIINHTNTKINILNQENHPRSRAVTRGTNSKVREELLQSMESQLKRCNESINNILTSFLIQEKLCVAITDE
ncbi:PREDICTED: integrator complex subunit 10-like isoform X2 [Amphimedon queenslandica]|uniref:Integrator complex subunit 10 n=1 Tax=Amphimedon queenslandica TaxID=400682 RepID=A0AAN0J253_AMPQE|nr:PREDICTED: integrator complex subunit 10-like isoform X2 [Amphimedon queenslandica]|eukprot:XP_019851129.1 PREDICTED: integrator complex subunit 10-like isoform X2 [Amphimedon queenslandica]